MARNYIRKIGSKSFIEIKQYSLTIYIYSCLRGRIKYWNSYNIKQCVYTDFPHNLRLHVFDFLGFVE